MKKGNKNYSRTTSRRQLLQTLGIAGLGLTIGPGNAQSAPRSDSAPDEEEYDQILQDMEGDGSENNPYVITTVDELQAIEGDKSANFELGNEIDASETGTWNQTDTLSTSFFRDQDQYRLATTPVVENSETVRFIESETELSEDEYTIDYATGVLELADPLPEDESLFIQYGIPEQIATGFDPIGRFSEPFTGVLDGDGHRILNLHINRPESPAVALINTPKNGAMIQNLKLINADIAARQQAAGIVGINYDTTIDRVAAFGTFEAFAGTVGTIVSDVRSGEITRCFGAGTVSGGTGNSVNYGGIAGYLSGGSIDQSVSVCAVDGDFAVGGVAGSVLGGASITRAYTTGDVSGQSRVGSIAGVVGRGSISNSYGAATISGQNTGGLVGTLGRPDLESGEEAGVADSYWDTQKTGQSNATSRIEEGDGTAELRGDTQGLSTEQMQGQSASENMTALDFEQAWRTTDAYAKLAWEPVGPPPVVEGSTPQDLDRDRVYEDLDGDGELSLTDVRLYFNEIYKQSDSEYVQNNREFFDVTDDGTISLGDVQALFEEQNDR